MKTSITSNLRPLLRALYPFVIAIAVLCGIPRNAHAQLYVTQLLSGGRIGIVSEYNADTGEVIKTNFITGLQAPSALALSNDGDTLFVTNIPDAGDSRFVGKYNAITGAAISPGLITGLLTPAGLAVLGDLLFVATTGDGTVREYFDRMLLEPLFITNLSVPKGLALSNDTLFVTNNETGIVGKYNADTGEAIKTNFITGLNRPIGIAVK